MTAKDLRKESIKIWRGGAGSNNLPEDEFSQIVGRNLSKQGARNGEIWRAVGRACVQMACCKHGLKHGH